MIAVGQVWRHVGHDLVPATGLRVEVVRVDWPYFFGVYPDKPKKGRPARYLIEGFDRIYELEHP